MSGWKSAGAGAKAATVGGGVAAAVGLALLGYYILPRQNPTVPDGVTAPLAVALQPAPNAAPVAQISASSAPDVAQNPNPEPGAPLKPAPEFLPPKFDLVRIEKDGSALIAGQAVPNSGVSVLVDGVVVSTVVADRSGGFAALFAVAPSDSPRLITLQMQLPDGREVASEEQVILAPADVTAPPSDVAMRETDTAVAQVAPMVTETPAPDGTKPATPLQVAPATNGAGAASSGGAVDMAALQPFAPNATTPGLAGPGPNALSPAGSDAAAPLPSASDAPVDPAAAPSAILVGPQGVRVMQDDTAQAPGKLRPVVIDAISYIASGAVQLGGRATPGALIRLYLDGALLAEFTVAGDGGWGGVLPDVAPGRYILRADQIGGDGKVTARFETPFQRETQAALAAVMAPSTPSQTPAPKTQPQTLTVQDPAPQIPTQQPHAVVAEPPATPVQPLAEPNPVQTPPVVASDAPTVAPVPALEPLAPVVASRAPNPLSSSVAGDTIAAPEPNPPSLVQNTSPAPVAAPSPVTPQASVSVTVQPGFTLWAIARDQFGDGIMYVQVYEANKDRIRNPDLIYPGQVFALPSQAQDPAR